jgi:cyclophilin family peptidyl-prolyl cis-trans isomerase
MESTLVCITFVNLTSLILITSLVFGKVVDGMDVVTKIENVKTNYCNIILTDVFTS